jgi:hypothetical protein
MAAAAKSYGRHGCPCAILVGRRSTPGEALQNVLRTPLRAVLAKEPVSPCCVLLARSGSAIRRLERAGLRRYFAYAGLLERTRQG